MKKQTKKTQKAVEKTACDRMSIIRWIVTAVDLADTCDSKARILGVFKSEQAAKDYVKADIDNWIENNVIDEDDKEDLTVDYDRMSVDIISNACEWNIEPVKIDL